MLMSRPGDALFAELDGSACLDLAEQAVVDTDPVEHVEVAGCAADLDAGPLGRHDVCFHTFEGLASDENDIGSVARVRSEEDARPGEEWRVAGEWFPRVGHVVEDVARAARGDELRFDDLEGYGDGEVGGAVADSVKVARVLDRDLNGEAAGAYVKNDIYLKREGHGLGHGAPCRVHDVDRRTRRGSRGRA